MTLAPPNGELVAQAWLAAYTQIPAGSIAGSLPKDPEKLTPEQRAKLWTDFFTVRALPAGVTNPDIVERRSSILQVDSWCRNLGSVKQPWGKAATGLERIRLATRRDVQAFGKRLEMPVAGYETARVFAAYLTSEPMRVEGDPSGYAHMTCDLAVDWTV